MKSLLNSTGTEVLQDLGKFFYLVPPKETTYKEVQDVPYYFAELFPLFLGLVCAEFVALAMKGKIPRLAESLNSLSHGIITETIKILTMGVEVSIYITIHNKYRLIDLCWDNPITWWVALLGVDLAYYFAHRASHVRNQERTIERIIKALESDWGGFPYDSHTEVNFLWAQHQIHHSSEDFNMAVAVRHPVTHNWINSFFYLPLALVIPPAQCLAHQQLNLLYQGWIHTSLVGELGPLEWIFNTPTHHKVHHGCNLYVLDKNYGGLLIIWDRIFGTFQSMKKDEELVFGVVFQPQSFNPLWQTWYRWPGLWQWAKSQKTWADSFRALCWGPSWIPGVGAPRLGRDEDKVYIRPRPKFVFPLAKWLQAYILIHFFAVVLVFQEFALKKGNFDEMTVAMTVAYLLVTLTSIGLLSEGNSVACYFEFFRCVVFFFVSSGGNYFLEGALHYYYLISMVIWAAFITKKGFNLYKLELKHSKLEDKHH